METRSLFIPILPRAMNYLEMAQIWTKLIIDFFLPATTRSDNGALIHTQTLPRDELIKNNADFDKTKNPPFFRLRQV